MNRRDNSQAGMASSNAGRQWGITPVMPAGYADAAWEDEAPGCSLAGPGSAAEHLCDASSRDHVARPRPLRRASAAHEEAHPRENHEHSQADDTGLDGLYEQSNNSHPRAEHNPGQCAWSNGQYRSAEQAAGRSQAPNQAPGSMHEGAFNNDEWFERGCNMYEQYVAENGFSDDEGWVQHCVETVLEQELAGHSIDENGYPVDDHGYGDGQHRSSDCESYPDDPGESDDDYRKLLVRQIDILCRKFSTAVVDIGQAQMSHPTVQEGLNCLHKRS